MTYNFIDAKGGYTFSELIKEIDKFDMRNNSYNYTYINARKSIDWCNFDVAIHEKIQFLIDWKTRYVSANREEYVIKFNQLAKHSQFITTINNYRILTLPFINLTNKQIITDLLYIYKEADLILKPTSASKILHMYNPDLFPIWDSFMRINLFRSDGHNPHHYVRWMSLMQNELNLLIEDTKSKFYLSSKDALEKIKGLDHPTCSLLRVMDKVNYNNSRTPLPCNISDDVIRPVDHNEAQKGVNMAIILSGGRVDTGLKVSVFIKDHLPDIDGFSMNKKGGFTFEEEKSLWRQGKMTAAFLKQVGSILQYPTYQTLNKDLLYSLKSDRLKILELLKKKPELDVTIRIKSKDPKPPGGSPGLLKSRLIDGE